MKAKQGISPLGPNKKGVRLSLTGLSPQKISLMHISWKLACYLMLDHMCLLLLNKYIFIGNEITKGILLECITVDGQS